MTTFDPNPLPDFLFLYGPPGVGKSTVAHKLAQMLKLPCVEIDVEIEHRAGISIRELFNLSGEERFRELEKEVLGETLAGPRAVIALGGGALLDNENRQKVEASGVVVCLTAPLDTLAGRIQAQPRRRPLLGLPDESAEALRSRLAALLQERQAHYASFPIQITTSHRTPEEVSWEIQVRLGCFHVRGMGQRDETGYPVCVRPGNLNNLGTHLQRLKLHDPVALVTDETVAQFYGKQVLQTLSESGYNAHLVTFPPGEVHKTLETVTKLWEAFIQYGLERRSTVVALGGGVATDLGGFAAASYLRGVNWIAVPTTLMGMADASLGGKTGFDLPQGKNLVGAFYPPRLVLVDPKTLQTLPERELRAGLGEVVKGGLIGDEGLFELCCQGWEMVSARLEEVVRRTMAVKIRLVQADPYEHGQRAALNLGHTIGHAVEHSSQYRLLHGEAVAIGLVAEARLAERMRIARRGLADRIAACLEGLGLPTRIPDDISPRAVIEAVHIDKKTSAGSPRFALALRPGRVQVGITISDWEKILFDEIGRNGA